MRAGGLAGLATAATLGLLVVACGGPDPAPARPAPRLATEIVQLRRDEVLQRVELAVTNQARELVTIESIDLQVPGLGGGGVQPKGEPLPPGQVVNLPTPYGEVSCLPDGTARVGRPRVVVRVHTASDPTSRRVVLTPRDPKRLLQRIATGECLTRRLRSEVSLAFGPTWRPVGKGRDRYLRGTLHARLLVDEPRDVTQLAGTVIYNLLPDPPTRPPGVPLAHLTPARPDASIRVVVSRARCTGHARGEVKKPYAFLVWLGPPGGEQRAAPPDVTDADEAAFEAICPL